jgi:predicted nucleic acid-binding protein
MLPQPVQAWMQSPPTWLEILRPKALDATLRLDIGEAAAIALAIELRADRLLIDERDGRVIAQKLGIAVAGTLAVLRDAGLAGLIDFHAVTRRLQQTTFRASSQLLDVLVAEFDEAQRNKK